MYVYSADINYYQKGGIKSILLHLYLQIMYNIAYITHTTSQLFYKKRIFLCKNKVKIKISVFFKSKANYSLEFSTDFLQIGLVFVDNILNFLFPSEYSRILFLGPITSTLIG